jgi:hypothetical protein
LTERVKLELELLPQKSISLFRELRSSKYNPTIFDRRVEGNDWYNFHQDTLHPFIVLIFSYYQKVYPITDLEEVIPDLLAQDVVIPEL